MDLAQTVTAKTERVRQHAHTVLAYIEGEFARMRELRRRVGYDHLCQRHSVDERSYFSMIIVGDLQLQAQS